MSKPVVRRRSNSLTSLLLNREHSNKVTQFIIIDKLTLMTNISDLDIKRKDTLQKCYDQVKTNLEKIFTDLLPGAVARLKLVDQTDVTQGC